MKQFIKLPIHTQLRTSVLCLLIVALLAACWKPSLPDLPSIPKELGDPSQVLKDLGLGDLTEQFSDINLTLPDISTPPGAINFNGPTAVNVGMGESIPGTNIKLTAINDQGAEFEIAGLRSLRKIGDSLDFDGTWPQFPDVSYTMRLRIFYIGSSSVRAAGVHRLLIPDIAPQVAAANLQLGGYQLKFSFVDNVNLNESIAGTTLVYAGEDSRGGIINGLPAGTYNFFKVGDSLSWIGLVRNQIGAQYDLRMIFYTASSAQIGGTVTVAMPTK
ncbi:MAG: hypothetical protein U0175_33570 [Caldilineaceae bacterium]